MLDVTKVLLHRCQRNRTELRELCESREILMKGNETIPLLTRKNKEFMAESHKAKKRWTSNVTEKRLTSGYARRRQTVLLVGSDHRRGGGCYGITTIEAVRSSCREKLGDATKSSSELVRQSWDIRIQSLSESDSVASEPRGRAGGVADVGGVAPGGDHDDLASQDSSEH